MKLTPRNRAAWRKWLTKNHADVSEVWVVFYKRHTGKPSIKYAEAVEEALCFGWIDGVIRRVDDERYMHRFSPRRPGSNWSETNKKRVAKLVKAKLMTEAGQKLIDEAKRTGRWAGTKKPKVDLEMSAEFADALAANPKARRNFAALTERQRSHYVGWINFAKRAATREKRIKESLELLERGEKLGLK